MEDESEFRNWDDLIPDALGLVFSNLSLQEMLTVVPSVCKSWRRAISGPYCWQEINLEEWSSRCNPDLIERMLRMLVLGSAGSLRKLFVCNLQSEDIFTFLSEHAGSLQTLRIPRSEITDSIVEQSAERFSTITFLDVSCCSKIGSRALEAFGKHCKSLVGLCRNMHPLNTADKQTRDDEANAIATTMPKLRHVELAYHMISTESVLKILSSCPELEYIDVRGCWDVKLDDKLLKEKFPKLKVLGPLVMDYYEINDWEDDCSDYSDESEYLAWEFLAGEMGEYDDDDSSFDGMWDDEGRLDELELRFYDGINDAGLYGWPPSP